MMENICYKAQKHQKENLVRNRMVVQKRSKESIWVNNKPYVDFSSNDYLGIRSDEKIKKSLMSSAQTYGLGSGASSHVSGYHRPHQKLEERFAEFLGREKALYFSSGYLANLGVITSLVGRNDVVLMDKKCHASIIDGVRLSRAMYFRYQHNNVNDLDRLLELKRNHDKLVISESIFGMNGDVVSVDALVATTKGKASLVIDDAHGIGVLGENGAGICEQFNLSSRDVPILITPLGKAFGSCGAVVSGDANIIDVITQFARTYLFSTALPPVIPCVTLTALDMVIQEKWRRVKLFENIQFFNEEAKKRSLKLLSFDATPMRCVLIDDIERMMKIKEYLMLAGIIVSAIRPPTVPRGASRLRISLSCCHEKNQIRKLLDLLVKCYEPQ